MWKDKHLNLGEIRVGVKIKLKFTYEGDIKVKQITSPCDCTEAIWDKETNTVEAIYTPRPVPKHIKNLGKSFYEAVKIIKVLSENKEDILTFTAIVKD